MSTPSTHPSAGATKKGFGGVKQQSGIMKKGFGKVKGHGKGISVKQSSFSKVRKGK